MYTLHKGNYDIKKEDVIDGGIIKTLPDIIDGHLLADNLDLTSLEFFPKVVTGNIDLSYNKLTSLEFFPDTEYDKSLDYKQYTEPVSNLFLKTGIMTGRGYIKLISNDILYLNNNLLTTFEHLPRDYNKSLLVDNNPFTSLQTVPINCTFSYAGSLEKSQFIEAAFFNSYFSSNNDYFTDLYNFIIDRNNDITGYKYWPEGFLTPDKIKSAKGIKKFDL